MASIEEEQNSESEHDDENHNSVDDDNSKEELSATVSDFSSHPANSASCHEDRKVCASSSDDAKMIDAKMLDDEETINNRILTPLSSVRSDNVNEQLEACLKSIKSGKRSYKQAHPAHNRHLDLISKKRLRKD